MGTASDITAPIIYQSTPNTNIAASSSFTVGALRRVRVVGTGFVWMKLGLGSATATKGTAGEMLISANDPYEFTTTSGQDTIALIEETAGAKVSVSLIG